ncbi:MAG: hypothetical protein IKJ18_01925 [Bacteroidaceae bacterium]|nr:hypothetical protein [Bacteroidaceae bacterium]
MQCDEEAPSLHPPIILSNANLQVAGPKGKSKDLAAGLDIEATPTFTVTPLYEADADEEQDTADENQDEIYESGWGRSLIFEDDAVDTERRLL